MACSLASTNIKAVQINTSSLIFRLNKCMYNIISDIYWSINVAYWNGYKTALKRPHSSATRELMHLETVVVRDGAVVGGGVKGMKGWGGEDRCSNGTARISQMRQFIGPEFN